jgi:hypothetical protein
MISGVADESVEGMRDLTQILAGIFRDLYVLDRAPQFSEQLMLLDRQEDSAREGNRKRGGRPTHDPAVDRRRTAAKPAATTHEI